jgi:hypothetical protein
MTTIERNSVLRSISFLPSERVIRALERIIEWRGTPLALRYDNDLEHINRNLITGQLKCKSRCCIFSHGNQHKTPASNDLNYLSGMSRGVYTASAVSNMPNYSRYGTFGHKITTSPVPHWWRLGTMVTGGGINR